MTAPIRFPYWLPMLLAVLVFSLPFEFRSFPVMSNLQWLFLAVSAAALPSIIRERRRLIRDRLVLAAAVFVLTQWVAAILADEFTMNAIKGAARVTTGFTLLCATLTLRDRSALLRVFAVSAIAAAGYGIVDYLGFGAPRLFRDSEFWYGPVMRLSGSFEYPNTAAAFFALSIPIVWAFSRTAWIRAGGTLLVWAALILTYSRGAIIAVFAMLLAWLWTGKSGTARLLAGACAAVFAAFLMIEPFLLERFVAAEPLYTMAAEYTPEFNRLVRRSDESGDLLIRIKNTGTKTWPAQQERPLTLTSRWYDAERGELVRGAGNDFPIPAPVRPQETVEIRASFHTPSREGLYILTWDISHSGTDWFSANGVVPGLVEVDVREGEPWSGNGDLGRWKSRDFSGLYVVNVPFSRRELWSAALGMAARNPFFGVGPDNFRLLYGREFNISGWDENIRSNSLYLELLAGSGLVGLAAFVFMIAAVRRSASAAAFAVFIVLVHGVVDVFLMTTPIYFATWILLAHAHLSESAA